MSIEFDIQESSKISGVYILTPSVFEDARGNTWTSFLKDEVERLLPSNLHFKHDKFSTSKYNVLRGIHGDTKTWKLVACVFGEVQQVVIDLRENSPTYRQWQSFILNQSNQQLILIPPNMGNAYCVNSVEAVSYYKFAYKGDYADENEQFTVSWDDDSIGIEWLSNNPILSNRDAK